LEISHQSAQAGTLFRNRFECGILVIVDAGVSDAFGADGFGMPFDARRAATEPEQSAFFSVGWLRKFANKLSCERRLDGNAPTGSLAGQN